MQYVRFMSVNELEKFKRGEVLANNTDWRKRAMVTDSVGFCFFGDEVPPEKRIEYLTGIVNLDRVAVFEQIGGRPMKESVGRYRDPERDLPDDIFAALFTAPVTMDVPEYSVETYSQETMRLVKVGKVTDPLFQRTIEWEDELCYRK